MKKICLLVCLVFLLSMVSFCNAQATTVEPGVNMTTLVTPTFGTLPITSTLTQTIVNSNIDVTANSNGSAVWTPPSGTKVTVNWSQSVITPGSRNNRSLSENIPAGANLISGSVKINGVVQSDSLSLILNLPQNSTTTVALQFLLPLVP